MVNGFWFDWFDDDDGALAGVTETLGVICCFFDDGNDGSGNVFCSLAADNPNTISSNLRLRFSLPPDVGSSTGWREMKMKKKKMSGSMATQIWSIQHTQLFFFISLVSMSSNFPLPANEEATPCFLDIEKSCTSDKSIGFFNISAMLTFGKLKMTRQSVSLRYGGSRPLNYPNNKPRW